MKYKWLWKILTVATIYFSCFAAQAYPLPAPPANPSNLGANIQRTMALMANSRPDHRNTVRILFYGQSITKDKWSRAVADDLRARFPQTNFVIKNRAIGGCASQCLIAPAEHDLYPFYPDLLIFHVYGSHIDYEKIIRKVRETTTAEVMLMTDHYTGPDAWSDRMSYEFIPKFAADYGCGLVESPDTGKDWPWEVGAIMRVRSQAKLQAEDWTVTITNFRSGTDFDFTVTGSVTGEDGSGSYADNPFVSRSERVVIDQADWWLASLKNVSITNGFKITWSVVPNFVDTYVPPHNPDPTIEQTTTLAQGLTNGRHTLELISSDGHPLPIKGIRVYHPAIGRSLNGDSRTNE